MAVDGLTKYRRLILRLFPRGRAWNREEGSIFYGVAEGLAAEMNRVEESLIAFMEEVDPRTTTQMLDEWEEMVKIPDECQGKASSIDLRRADVLRKLLLRGGASRQFFKDLAAAIGYDVEVSEPSGLARVGVFRAGDRLYGVEWLFWFQISTDSFDLDVFRCGVGRCGDRLRTFRNDILECVIERAKPAHTNVQFVYGS